MAMAKSRADSVRRLIEKPNTHRKRKVPIKATGTAIIGMSVERKSCRKTYTTRNTNKRVMTSVMITSWMEAKRKSVTSYMMTVFMPGGMDFCALSSAAFTSVAIWVALEPAICCTIPIQAGMPSLRRLTLYISDPSSILATSLSFSV